MLYQLGGKTPRLEQGVFVAPSADVIGDVILRRNVSVWYQAVLRGDSDTLEIGEDSNIQDGAVVHTDPGLRVVLGRGVTVGHKAVVHGCTIDDYTLIGINAVVLNRAIIGKYCLIGANALITERTVIPDRSMVLGSPGKVVRTLTDEQVEGLKKSAANYVAKRALYLDGCLAI